MCAFSLPPGMDFSTAMLRFVAAPAGCIAPQPGRVHFNLNRSADDTFSAQAETRAAPADSPAPLTPTAGAATAFNLDACFDIAPALDLPERIAPIARPA